jgi:phosphoribosylformylglycinamidine (FGAM) synthase PurS component
MNVHMHLVKQIVDVEAKTIGGTTYLLDFTIVDRDGSNDNVTIFFDTEDDMKSAVKGMAMALLEAI